MKKIHFNDLSNLQLLLADTASRGISNEVLATISLTAHQSEILAAIDNSLGTMQVTQAWINFYPIGMGNELHDHSHEVFQSISDHLVIFILKSALTPEKFLCKDSLGITQEYDAIEGDCFVIKNSEIHGFKECSNAFTAVTFLLKTT